MNTLDNFVVWLREEGRKPGTISTYLQVTKFQDWWTENKLMDSFVPEEVTTLDLQEYKQYLIQHARNKQGGRLAASTVNKVLQAIRTYFKFLADTGVIAYNPALKVKSQKIQNRYSTVRWLEEKEKLRLLRYVNDPKSEKSDWRFLRNRAIIYTFLMAGLRVSELVKLIIPDVDLSKRRLNVHDGKGGKERDIPINADLYEALSHWLEYRQQYPGEHFFISQRKGPFSLMGIEHIFDILGNKTGLTDFTPHVLRHTFCHDLIVKGYGIEVVAQLAGHDDLNTTRIYTLPSQAVRQKATNSLSLGDSF